MINIQEKQADRFLFLEKVYEKTDGDLFKGVHKGKIAEKLCWNKEKLESVVQYLFDERLITADMTGNVWITHSGAKEIEQAKTSPNEPIPHFLPINIIMVENTTNSMTGNVTNSQFQQATIDSSQTLTMEFSDKDSMLKTLSEIKKAISEMELDEQSEKDLLADIETVKAETKRTKPRPGILKALLGSIKSVSKGVLEKTGATVLAEQLPQWISQLGEYIGHL